MAELVTIATFDRTSDAELARALLASEGIPAVVQDEHAARVFTGVPGALGTVRLQVAAADEDAARAVLAMDEEGYDEFLAEIQAEAAGGDVGEDEKDLVERPSGPRCPHCGSDNLFTEPLPFWKQLLGIVLLGIPFIVYKRSRECAICGTKFSA